MGLSIAYFTVVCLLTIGAIVFTVSGNKPEKPRLRGLSLFATAVAYTVVSVFLADSWGELMNRWYGQWPAFTLGIIFGIPVVVITAGTALGIVGAAVYTMILGRIPAWIETISAQSVWSRLGLGLAVVFSLVILAGFVMNVVLRHH